MVSQITDSYLGHSMIVSRVIREVSEVSNDLSRVIHGTQGVRETCIRCGGLLVVNELPFGVEAARFGGLLWVGRFLASLLW